MANSCDKCAAELDFLCILGGDWIWRCPNCQTVWWWGSGEERMIAVHRRRVTGREVAALLVEGNGLCEELRGMDLSGQGLSGLRFARMVKGGGIILVNGHPCPDLRFANFDDADLSDADLSGAYIGKCSFRRAMLRRSCLSWVEAEVFFPADQSTVDFTDAVMTECDLTCAKLERCVMHGAKLAQARLVEANFGKGDLSGADLSGIYGHKVSFHKANLRGAILRGADLTQADLEGADLSGVDLRDVRLDSAHTSDETVWPQGFDERTARERFQMSYYRIKPAPSVIAIQSISGVIPPDQKLAMLEARWAKALSIMHRAMTFEDQSALNAWWAKSRMVGHAFEYPSEGEADAVARFMTQPEIKVILDEMDAIRKHP